MAWRADPAGRWYVAVGEAQIDAEALSAWVGRPDCGAVVTFAGTTRDHGAAPGGGVRTGVTLLEYEAYEGPALDRLVAVATAVLARWPDCGAVAVAHRLGPVRLGETSVVVTVSAPHRDGAFEAARFAIDATKATVPVWKREHHDGGVAWGADASPVLDVASFGGTASSAVEAGDTSVIVRPGAPVADTGGAARRAAAASGPDTGRVGEMADDPEPEERTWAT